LPRPTPAGRWGQAAPPAPAAPAPPARLGFVWGWPRPASRPSARRPPHITLIASPSVFMESLTCSCSLLDGWTGGEANRSPAAVREQPSKPLRRRPRRDLPSPCPDRGIGFATEGVCCDQGH